MWPGVHHPFPTPLCCWAVTMMQQQSSLQRLCQVLGSNQVFIFFVTGGGTFALRHSGLMSCGIPDDDTIVMTGGGWTFKHNFVTRWVHLKKQTITYMAQRSNHHNHDTRILQSKPSNITLRDGFLRKTLPKALRTQALTALTSKFSLVGSL